MSDRVEPNQIQLDPGEAARGALIADFASTVKSQFKSLDQDSDNFLSVKELDFAAADSSRPNQQRDLFKALSTNEDKVSSLRWDQWPWQSHKGISMPDVDRLGQLGGDMAKDLAITRGIKSTLEPIVGNRSIKDYQLVGLINDQPDNPYLLEAQRRFRQICHTPRRDSCQIDSRDLNYYSNKKQSLYRVVNDIVSGAAAY